MDFSKLNTGSDINKTVIYAGRELQADADFYCYFAANLDTPVANNVKHLIKILDSNRKLVGAEHVNAHITMGSKGGRHEMATVRPYQFDRGDGDPNVKQRVKDIRTELANWAGTDETTVIANVITEADDSITRYHTNYNASGKGLSIIDSGDKDLNMVQGVHRDANTKKLIKVTGYGKTNYADVGNVELKLKGYGDSWFWHQMLMGDSTDKIPGLEKLTPEALNVYVPTKKFNPKRKSGPCGEKKAVAILLGVTDSKIAGERILALYRDYYGTVLGEERFVEQMFLLWMRRTNNMWDCIVKCNELGIIVKPSLEQLKRAEHWKQLMVGLHGGEAFK